MRISDWSSDVCSSDLLAREFLHRWRRLSFRILLIHAVEHRQADRLRVDQFGAVAARIDRIDEPARELDALPALAIAAVEDEDMTRHRITLKMDRHRTLGARTPDVSRPARGRCACLS